MSHTPEHETWGRIKDRCFNTACHDYADYGGRGITVSPAWRDSFEQFYADMGPRPANHSIERIDNNGPYSANNCRWLHYSKQASNRRSNRRIEFNGKSMTLDGWARHINVTDTAMRHRLKYWSINEALTRPARPFRGLRPRIHQRANP